MNFHFRHWGLTLAGHFYSRKYHFWHECNVTDCPARQPPDGTKYVIANRITGSYSEKFDSREDVEKALRYFSPFGSTDILRVGKRYEILEAVMVHGHWMIVDHALNPDQIMFLPSQMLFEEVDIGDGQTVPRLKYIGGEPKQ